MIRMHPYRAAFISDLDGTLLRDPQGVTPDDYAALVHLGTQHVVRVIATGRAVYSVQNCLAADFPIDYVIASSGNQIVHWQTQDVVHSSNLPVAHAMRIQDVLMDLDLCFMAHRDFPDNHACIYQYGSSVPEDFRRRLGLYASSSWHGLIDQHWGAVSQFVAITEQVQAVEQVRTALADASVIRATSPLDGRTVWIEIFAPQVCKANAIVRLTRGLGFTDQPLAAIGNDFNDIDMLDLVHFPYIVSDALITGQHYVQTPARHTSAVAYAAKHFTQVIQGDWHGA